MYIHINSKDYLITDNTIFVPHTEPLPLSLLKPTYRRIGNTIGRIPLSFLI